MRNCFALYRNVQLNGNVQLYRNVQLNGKLVESKFSKLGFQFVSGVIVTDLQRRGGLDEEKYKNFLLHSKVMFYWFSRFIN